MSPASSAPAGPPVVAIIGRPNVGKSTLFNRIAGYRQAIVHDEPGVTRDRIERRVEWGGVPFLLVDTGGFDPGSPSWAAREVAVQARQAVAGADRIIFLADAAAGVAPLDREVADILRRSGKPVHLVVNKVDHPTHGPLAGEFAALGFFPVHAISAEHGIGIGELLDEVVARLPRESLPEPQPAARVALVGRPNVGKSTLANRLLGTERFITHHEPGTTRDAVETPFTLAGREYLLVDTAGIRRRGRVDSPVEKFSVLRARDAAMRSDVCLLVLDAREMITEQDTKVAGLVHEAGRACIIVVNKWDLMEGTDRGEAERRVREAMVFMDWAPVLFVSARTGLGLHRVAPLLWEVIANWHRTLSAPELNRFLHRAVNAYKPTSFHGKAISLGYMTQARSAPPAFVILTNEPSRIHLSYRRYLGNRMREEFGFRGVPLALRFRRKGARGR